MFGPTDVAGVKAKVLLRIFCHAHGNKVVLLIGGYDKAGDPSDKAQAAAIQQARKRLAAFKAREVAEKKVTPERKR